MAIRWLVYIKKMVSLKSRVFTLVIRVACICRNLHYHVVACAGTPNALHTLHTRFIHALLALYLYLCLNYIDSTTLGVIALDQSFNSLLKMAGGPQRVLLALSDRPYAI
jgi:hypothetical protein